MKNFFDHAGKYVFRGLLAIIPLLLCALAVQLLYVLIDKRVMGFTGKFFEGRQVPGLGILLLIIFLYLIGLIVSNIIGRQLFNFIEKISRKIPFIKAIYGVGKQLSQGLAVGDENKQAFKKAVLVKFDQLLVPAFVMGSITNPETKEEFLSVLIPTAPTPASGFAVMVKASQTIDPGWSIEECLKYIVSAGIVFPQNIKLH